MDQLKKKVFKSLHIFLLSLALLAFVYALLGVRLYGAIEARTPATNTITVSGEGEVSAVADVVSFSFGVTKEGTTVAEAQDAASSIVAAALAYLKDQDIAETDIKTDYYNLYPRYEYPRIVCVTYPCPEGERTLKGYEVTQSIRVKVRDVDSAGKLVGGLGELGVTDVSGLQFIIDDEDALRRDARKEAIEEAEEKAQLLARDLGVRIKRIVHFNEYGNDERMFMIQEASFDGAFGGSNKVSPSLPAGENKVISRVSITYEIR